MNPYFAFADFFDQGKLNPFLALLAQKMAAGNVCLDLNDADPKADVLLSSGQYEQDILSHPLVGGESELQPFILHDNKLYLQRYFKYETQFIEGIRRMISEEDADTAMQDISAQRDMILSLFPAKKNDEPDWQMVATLSALLHRFHIITGGPGTGKTTSVARLLTIILYRNPDARILLAAPTGKAAMRMAESLGNVEALFHREKINVNAAVISHIRSLKPLTIHSLLGYRKNSIYFNHNASNPLPADVVIADECSMVDIALFAKLMETIGPDTKLILLGDKNQLSSVEAGSLFGDLCSSLPEGNIFDEKHLAFLSHFMDVKKLNAEAAGKHLLTGHITELRQSHRFNDAGGIGKFSKAVIQHDEAVIREFDGDGNNQVSISGEAPGKMLESFAQQYADYIKFPDIAEALELMNRAKILCAVKQGPLGVYKMNTFVEQYLAEQGLIKPDGEFYENKLIMVTKNQPEAGLYNGDTGILRMQGGVLRACFLNPEGGVLSVPPAQIDSWEPAFAMTIHKSQGSEFDEVMIILPPSDDSPILTRELLYTAVTRARKKALILADMEIVLSATRKHIRRISGIVNRIKS